MIELRPYQETCIKRVLASFESDKSGQELLVLPTGAGKTVIFCQVIHKLELPTLIIAHRDELLDQAAEKYRMIKPDAIIGKVGGGTHEYGCEVTVASVSTISRPRHLERLKEQGYGLIIVDEAHHVAADGYRNVLETLPEVGPGYVQKSIRAHFCSKILPQKCLEGHHKSGFTVSFMHFSAQVSLIAKVSELA